MRATLFRAAAQNHQKVKVSQTSFNLSVILTRKTNRTTFRVYFCLELDGDTITQMVTINLPAEWQAQRERQIQRQATERNRSTERERRVQRETCTEIDSIERHTGTERWEWRETGYREAGTEDLCTDTWSPPLSFSPQTQRLTDSELWLQAHWWTVLLPLSSLL